MRRAAYNSETKTVQSQLSFSSKETQYEFISCMVSFDISRLSLGPRDLRAFVAHSLQRPMH